MIRVSEAVLPGHPDKLCDLVAESLVQAALAVGVQRGSHRSWAAASASAKVIRLAT